MERVSFALNLFDLAFICTVFVGLSFALLLCFTKRINRQANIFLGLGLLTIVSWIIWVLAIDIHLGDYFPRWSWMPLQYSLALGPAIYLYVRGLVHPKGAFASARLWHFSPLVLELFVQFMQVVESRRSGKPTYETAVFNHFNPLIQLLALVSVVSYLVASLRLLKAYQNDLEANFSDFHIYQYNWLKRLLVIFGIVWLLWIPFVTVDFLLYDYGLGIGSYYPLYLLLAVTTIWISAEAFLRPEIIRVEVQPSSKVSLKNQPDTDLLRQAECLRQQMELNLYYLDPGLNLRSLAEQLGMHPNELSRITNIAIGKSFNDFINEYRVRSVISKLEDPSFDKITLLGIAFDSGFNSKTTFNRTFKDVTGKTPIAYKQALQTGAKV